MQNAIASLQVNATPAFSTIDGFCEIASISRSALYLALGRGDIRAVKAGKRTLIETGPALDWLRNLPPAKFRAPTSH